MCSIVSEERENENFNVHYHTLSVFVEVGEPVGDAVREEGVRGDRS